MEKIRRALPKKKSENSDCLPAFSSVNRTLIRRTYLSFLQNNSCETSAKTIFNGKYGGKLIDVTSCLSTTNLEDLCEREAVTVSGNVAQTVVQTVFMQQVQLFYENRDEFVQEPGICERVLEVAFIHYFYILYFLL